MRRFLDSSLELLIALARVLSVLGLLAVVGLGFVMSLTGDLFPWISAWLQAVLWSGVFGWFGWWFYGNAEWRRRDEGTE